MENNFLNPIWKFVKMHEFWRILKILKICVLSLLDESTESFES